MKTTYKTTVIGIGNHASIEIPEENLLELGAHRRAPLKVTINNHTYQSTATAVDGICMVVFPTRDREVTGIMAGDVITVTLELDSGYREVELSRELSNALNVSGLTDTFRLLPFFRRSAYAKSIIDAKTETTKTRRIHKIITELT